MSGSASASPMRIIVGDTVTISYTWYDDGSSPAIQPSFIQIEANPNSPGETHFGPNGLIFPATIGDGATSSYTYTPATWGRIDGGGYKRTSYLLKALDTNQNSLHNYSFGITLYQMPTMSVVASPSTVTSEGQVVTFSWTATGNFDKVKYDYTQYNGNAASSTLYTLYGAQQGQTRTGTITQTQGPGQPLQGYTGQKDFVFIAEHGFNSPYYVPSYINSRLYASATATVTLAVPWYEVSTNKTNYSEGEIINGTVTTTSVATGTTLYWAMTTNSGTYAPEDFTNTGAYQPHGSGTVTNGSFTFSAQVKNDSISEGMETRRVRLYTDSARTNYVRQSPQFYILPSDQPSYGISAAQSVYNEGQTVYCGVSTTNVAPGTTLYWKITGASINEQDFIPNSVEGQGNISSSGSFTFNRTISTDQLSESTETFKLQLFTNSARTSLVAESPLYSIIDTSQSISHLITPSSLNVVEGGSITYLVETTGYPAGSTMYWAMEGVGITEDDFSPVHLSSGATLIGVNGGFEVFKNIVADELTEGSELIYFRCMYPTSDVGDIVATNTQVSILDTSTNPPLPAPTINFYASPTQISIGQTSTLFWNVINSDTVTIDQGVGSVPNSSNVVVSPTTTTVYTLSASGPGGSSSATVTIDTTLPVALMVSGPSTIDWQAASIPIQISASNSPGITLYETYDGVVKPHFEIPNSDGSVTFAPYNYTPDWSTPVDTIQLHFAAGPTASETLVIAVNVDKTPDAIILPPSPAAPDEEVTSPPVPASVTDIDVPVEVKSDQPIKVEIDGSNNWNNVREI